MEHINDELQNGTRIVKPKFECKWCNEKFRYKLNIIEHEKKCIYYKMRFKKE